MDDGLQIVDLEGHRGLRLIGELTSESAPLLGRALKSMRGNGQATLDLSDLTFVDSTGLHAIATFARSENGGGRVILQGVAPYIARLFQIISPAENPNLDIRALDGR